MAKTVFLSVNVDTGQVVQNFSELKKLAKDLQAQLNDMKPDSRGFEPLKEKVILAKQEIQNFNSELRVSPTFVDRMSAAIRAGFGDVAVRAQAAEQSIAALKNQQSLLVAEFAKTNDAARKLELEQKFKDLDAQLKTSQGELKNLNSTLEKGLNENKSAIEKFAGSVKQTFKEIGLAIVAAFAVEKIVEFGKSSFEAYAKQEEAEKRLLVALGGRKEITEELVKQAKELQDKTNIKDEEIIQQQAFLANQGRTEEQIKKTITAAIAFSKVTGEDLSSAVHKLDATFEGNIGRLGKIDKGFKDLSQEQLANGEAIDLVNQKYGDFAEQIVKTPLGKIEHLGVEFSEAKEQVGQLIVAGLSKLAPAISAVIAGFTSFIKVIAAIPSFVKENKDAFIALGVALISFNAVNIAAAANSLRTAAALKLQQIATFASTAAQEGLNIALKSNPIGFVVGLIATLVAAFITLYNRSETVRGAISGLFNAAKVAFTGIKDLALSYLTGVGDLIAGVFTFDTDRISAGIDKLKNGFVKYGTDVANSFKEGYQNSIKESDLASQISEAVGKPEIVVDVNADQNEVKKTRKQIEDDLQNVKALIQKVEIGSDAEKDLLAKKKELEDKLTQLDPDKAAKKEKTDDHELQDKLAKELKLVQDVEKAKTLAAAEGTIARLELEKKAEENIRAEKIKIANATIKDKKDKQAEIDAINAESAEKQKQLDNQIAGKQLEILKQKNAAIVASTQAGSQERINAEIQSIQTERDLQLQNVQFTEDQKIVITKTAEEKINQLTLQKIEQRTSTEKYILEAQKSRVESAIAYERVGTERYYELKAIQIQREGELEKNSFETRKVFLQQKLTEGEGLNEQEYAEFQNLKAREEQVDANTNHKLLENKRDEAQKEKEIQMAYAEAAGQIANQLLQTWVQSSKQRSDAEINNIHTELDEKTKQLDIQQAKEEGTYVELTATEKKYNALRQKAKDEATAKERKLKHDQWVKEKEAAILSGIIATALGVAKASPVVPLMILAGVLGAIQVGIIASQKVPEFRLGTILNYQKFKDGYLTRQHFAKTGMIARGATHEQVNEYGETGIALIDSKTGNKIGEMEDEEIILTKGVSRDPVLRAAASRLNEIAGGAKLADSSVLDKIENENKTELSTKEKLELVSSSTKKDDLHSIVSTVSKTPRFELGGSLSSFTYPTFSPTSYVGSSLLQNVTSTITHENNLEAFTEFLASERIKSQEFYNQKLAQPIRAHISESEVTNAQAVARKIEQNSQLFA